MIGDKQSLKTLAEADSADILVISDSHGNWHNLEKAVTENGKGCQALIFLGDGINDLVSVIENKTENLPPIILFVRGNGDSATCSIFTDSLHNFDVPEEGCLKAAGKNIFATHGHHYSVYYTRNDLFNYLKKNGYEAGLFGHTHVPYQEYRDNILLLNPGSCSNPRNHSDKNCVTLHIEKNNSVISYQFHPLDQES